MSKKKDRAFTVRFAEEQFHHIAEQAERAMMSPNNYLRAVAGRVNVILDGKAVGAGVQGDPRHLSQGQSCVVLPLHAIILAGGAY